MSLIDHFFQNVEDFITWIGIILNQRVESYVDLETADSKHVLVGKDGSLVSVIKLDGYRRFVGADEFAFLTERMTSLLQPILSAPGHSVQFFFSHNREGSKQAAQHALEPAKRTAKRLGLNIRDLLDARADIISEFTIVEHCYIVIWSTKDVLEKTHLRHLEAHHARSLKSFSIPKYRKAQNILAVLPEMRNIHDSTVHTLLEDMGHIGYFVRLMNVHELVRDVRKSIDPDFTDDSWEPYLPGDVLPTRFQKVLDDDLSNVLWPSIPSQVVPRKGRNVDFKIARAGDMLYAPMYIELFPKEIKPFYEFFRKMIANFMPWRMSYFLNGDGIRITSSKNVVAQFLTWSSHYNRLLVDTHKMLKRLHEQSDDPVVRFTVVLTTWAHVRDRPLLEERAAKLAKLVQSWGGCDVREVSGDPFGTMMSSALAARREPVANASAAPLSEAVFMLPIVRPASPWDQGAVLFRTPDGKLWPYQPGSNKQVSWIDLIYARSGSGKSVLLSTLNLALCLTSGLSALPRVAIIDIGPSSRGFISLLQGALPKEEAYQVAYHRLRMHEDDAINPFDTNMGARYPTKLHRAFLVNFISLLLSDNMEENPPEGLTSMLSMVIDETYKRYGDQGQAKVYVPHAETDVHEKLVALKSTGMEALRDWSPETSSHQTWWQMVDILFEAGELQLALKAQRQAMPTIADTISMAHLGAIKDLYGEVTTSTGEDYITYYCRVISSVIRNYPTLTYVTRLNLEGTRIVALDLDEVAKTGSAAADKQTAIVYMLARHILAQQFFLHADDVEQFPSLYRPYHKRRIKEIMEEPKRMVFDEFHRTSKSQAVREQVVQDMREGRKWKIQISLASQSLQDFDKLMIEFATSIYILAAGSTAAVEDTCRTFGLSDTERRALNLRCHGPTSQGTNFVAQFMTKMGANTQLLTSTISAVELWAFSTTTEDVSLRDTLYEMMPPAEARHLLAEQFPRGSAVKEIELALKADPTLTVGEVRDDIVKRLTRLYRKRLHERDFENIEQAFFDEKE